MHSPTTSSIFDQIRAAADDIIGRTTRGEIEIGSALAEALRAYLVWPYAIGPVQIAELSQSGDQAESTAIYTSGTGQQQAVRTVGAANAACVFHCVQSLTVQELRKGYQRIGAVKRIEHPSPSKVGAPLNDATMGIILAVDSLESLDAIAETMMELNRTVSSREWPDAVVVLNRGAVNYAVQIEGDKIKGNFLLPNLTDFRVMPMYVHIVGRTTGLTTLNWLFSFLFMHLQIFSPGAKLPDTEAVAGAPSVVMTFGGYQFNLKCHLVPVPDEMRQDKGAGLRNLPFRIESQKGELLAHVYFVPWQEGGAVRIVGKLPLEAILVYLGPVMKGAQIIQQENGRISSVLPISRDDFISALRRLQAQSNMIVKPEQPSWIVSKIADEGSSSPHMARLYMGVMRIRDQAFTDRKERDAFDKPYESTMTALSDARSTAKDLQTLVESHRSKVLAGEAAHLQGKAIHVDGIDKELRKHMSDFLTSAGRSLKHGMQSVAKVVGINIGFFFKDVKQFEKGLSGLSATHPELSDYLRQARAWGELLNIMRNKVEHEGWVLPRVGYRDKSGEIEMLEPEVNGQPVSKFADYILDRLCCFVEEVTIYGLRTKLNSILDVAEIPLNKRDAAAPERFRPTLAKGGEPTWKLAYHTSRFEQV